VQIATVAVLLQDEGAWYAGSEVAELYILQPDVSISHKMLVRKPRERLHLDQDLLQPLLIISNRHSLASEVAYRVSVKYMSDKKHDSPTTLAEHSLLNEEVLEIVLAEGRRRDSICCRGRSWRASHKFSIWRRLRREISTRLDWLYQTTAWRRGYRRLRGSREAVMKHPKVPGTDEGRLRTRSIAISPSLFMILPQGPVAIRTVLKVKAVLLRRLSNKQLVRRSIELDNCIAVTSKGCSQT
jgi:hypothetical protein